MAEGFKFKALGSEGLRVSLVAFFAVATLRFKARVSEILVLCLFGLSVDPRVIESKLSFKSF